MYVASGVISSLSVDFKMVLSEHYTSSELCNLRGGFPMGNGLRSLLWKGFEYPSRQCGQLYRSISRMEQFLVFQGVGAVGKRKSAQFL